MFIESLQHKDGRKVLRLLGPFSGQGDFEEIDLAFRKNSVLGNANEIHLETGSHPETGENFHVNGQGAFLIRHIARRACGKEIICHSPELMGYTHILKPREKLVA